MTANERQVGGDHYKTGGTELWDLFGPESIIFYAVRYLQRWRKKNGVEDLKKALHCVQKLREIAPHHAMRNVLRVDDSMFESWMCNAVDGADERAIIRRLVIWYKNDVELEFAEAGIQYLIRKEESKPPAGVAAAGIEGQAERSLEDLKAQARAGAGVVKPMPDHDLSETKLREEYKALEMAQENAVGWGAAVGVRHERMREIERELHSRERRVPRYAEGGYVSAPGSGRTVAEMLTPCPNDSVMTKLSDGEYSFDGGATWTKGNTAAALAALNNKKSHVEPEDE